MMMLTCSESSGDCRTGIMWDICGSISEIWLTSRKKPDMSSPKVSMMGKRRMARKVSSCRNHASTSIVS